MYIQPELCVNFYLLKSVDIGGGIRPECPPLEHDVSHHHVKTTLHSAYYGTSILGYLYFCDIYVLIIAV